MTLDWDSIKGAKYETYLGRNDTRTLCKLAKMLVDECDSIVVEKAFGMDDIRITIMKRQKK